MPRQLPPRYVKDMPPLASDAQVSYIHDLLQQKQHDGKIPHLTPDSDVAAVRLLTKRDASEVIGFLRGCPLLPPSAPPRELNPHIEFNSPDVEPGLYLWSSSDGLQIRFIKVTLSQKGYHYAAGWRWGEDPAANPWIPTSVAELHNAELLAHWKDGDARGAGDWLMVSGLYERMVMGNVQVTPLSAEAAAMFGAITGNCVFCSRDLSDERSIDVGYGPTCATKNNLPWGEK